MATIVQPYNPWREQLALTALGNVAGSIIGDIWKTHRENQQNRKINAFRGQLNQDLRDNVSQGQGVSLVPQNLPEGYNSNPWANAFHKTDNPITQFDLGTAGAAQNTQRTPSIRDIMQGVARLAATPRFSMLGADTVNKIRDDLLQGAYADMFANAGNIGDQMTALAMGAAHGKVPYQVLNAYGTWGAHNTPHHESKIVDAGSNQVVMDYNPKDGSTSVVSVIPKGVNPTNQAVADTNANAHITAANIAANAQRDVANISANARNNNWHNSVWEAMAKGIDKDIETLQSQLDMTRNSEEADRINQKIAALKAQKDQIYQGSLQNTQNAPNDNQNNNYDGFIGFLDVNQHNGESHSANIFLDEYNGKPYLDFTDENGDSVAVFDINSDSFSIRPDHLTSGWVRYIEGDFRRNFGKNTAEEILRRSFRQKAIDAGVNEQNADATATVYIAGNKSFAKYSGQSLFDTANSDNISIEKGQNQQNNNSRGSTTFVEQQKDDSGNVIQEAQTIVKLFQNADQSTLLHEIGHIFLNKLKNLARAGLIRNNKGKLNQAGIDWGIILREYGLKDIDFSNELSGKNLELWHNAQENFASSLEKYFLQRQAPQSFSQRMKHVFKAFKGWFQDIYHSVRDIKYTDAKGKQHAFSLSKNIKSVFDNLLSEGNYTHSAVSENINQENETSAAAH